MTSATITITDITQPVASLHKLLENGNLNGANPGYTVAPAGGFGKLVTWGDVSYCSLQSSPSNTATVYKGDENVKTNGTLQSKEMQPGDVDVIQSYSRAVSLHEIYITAQADGAKVNVEIHTS